MKTINAVQSQFAQIKTFQGPARLFLIATIFDGIVYSGWGLFFNFYILERGFDRGFLGMVNAMPSIAALLLGIPMGLLSDRLGRKRAMIAGLTISILCMALEVTVSNPVLILVTAFIAGAAGSLYFLSQAPFMMKVSNENNRTLLFSLNFGLVTLAGSVGSIFAGQLPGFFGSWLHVSAGSATAYQAVLLASAALSIFTLVPLALIRLPAEVPEQAHEVRQEATLKQVIFRPLTLKLALPNLLIGSGAAILIPYMNLFFSDRYQMRDQTLGVLFSLSALLTGVGSIIGPRLAGNLGSKIRAVVFTQAASLMFLLVLGFSPFLGLAVLGYLMRGVLMNMAVPLYSAFVMEQTHEREQATVNSVKELAWQVGWSVGPYVSGVVQQAYGFTPLFVATAMLYTTATLVTWLFFGQHERKLIKANQDVLSTLPMQAVSVEPGEALDA
ncbi:MAG: MFS transporter [Chloroflexota bacterium]|nr:MAG: MFS transporter [Chloroflexota bacterium]